MGRRSPRIGRLRARETTANRSGAGAPLAFRSGENGKSSRSPLRRHHQDLRAAQDGLKQLPVAVGQAREVPARLRDQLGRHLEVEAQMAKAHPAARMPEHAPAKSPSDITGDDLDQQVRVVGTRAVGGELAEGLVDIDARAAPLAGKGSDVLGIPVRVGDDAVVPRKGLFGEHPLRKRLGSPAADGHRPARAFPLGGPVDELGGLDVLAVVLVQALPGPGFGRGGPLHAGPRRMLPT